MLLNLEGGNFMIKYFITKWLWRTLGVLKGMVIVIVGSLAAIGGCFIFSDSFRDVMTKNVNNIEKDFDEKFDS